MEKIGVEVEKKQPKSIDDKFTKIAAPACRHPAHSIRESKDGDTKFCNNCGKYLKLGNQ